MIRQLGTNIRNRDNRRPDFYREVIRRILEGLSIQHLADADDRCCRQYDPSDHQEKRQTHQDIVAVAAEVAPFSLYEILHLCAEFHQFVSPCARRTCSPFLIGFSVLTIQ